jgi:hypothetical protein
LLRAGLKRVTIIRTGAPAAINVFPSDPVMFCITTAVTVRPTVSLRELMESSSATWISVPMGSVREAAVVVAVLDAAAAVGAELDGAVLGASAVSGSAVDVSATAVAAVSGRVVVTVSTGRRAVSLLATALSITGEGTVSTIGEAVASVSDTTAEAVSERAVSVGTESTSAFGA